MKAQNLPHHGVKIQATRNGNKVSWPTYVSKTVITGKDKDGNDVTEEVDELKVESKTFHSVSAAKYFMRTGKETERVEVRKGNRAKRLLRDLKRILAPKDEAAAWDAWQS